MKFCTVRTLVLATGMFWVLTGCSQGTSPRKYYKSGIESLEERRFHDAEVALSKACSIKTDKAEYIIAYGMSLIGTGKYKEALEQFDKAILSQDNQVVRENNKEAYRGKGIAYYKVKQYEEAVEEFDRALEINELEDIDVDILYYKALVQEDAKLYEEALETYEEVRGKTKGNGIVCGKIAKIQLKLKDYVKAEEEYNKGILLEPDNYSLYFGKYFLFLELKQEIQAQEALKQALEIKADSTEDNFNVAKIYYYQKDFDNAKLKMEELVGEGITQAYSFLGEIYTEEGDFERAIDSYNSYLEEDTGSSAARVYNLLGLCYMEKKDYQKALETFREGIELNDGENMGELMRNEIIACEYMADYSEALKLVKIYLETYQDDKEMMREFEYIKTRVSNVKEVEE